MYSWFFSYEGEIIQLPIPPDKLVTKVGSKNKVIDLIALGEYNILKEIPLRNLSFKILLPHYELPFVQTSGGFEKPIYYLNHFRQYKINKKHIRLVITRELPTGEIIFGGNMLVSMEEYTVTENAGEEGDFWVDIMLKEFPELVTNTVELDVDGEVATTSGHSAPTSATSGAITAVETNERPAKEPVSEYIVQPGDTLWMIAKKNLNDGAKYAEIASLNGLKNPNVINAGQVLKIPGVDAA
ncbi:MAG: LysM peptidoglycan-binding domain-containing protein [Clostridiales bacterium]|jgi:LysM repeat protein|nr:LysM peptidoglycan-binding domain-containing protein [Clostridiales bacterium]